MKKNILLLAFSLSVLSLMAQKPTIYHPEANATADIDAAVQRAKAEHKYVLLQGGGNWCKWCVEFHRVCTTDKHLDSLINENFVWYHLNYSKEKKTQTSLKNSITLNDLDFLYSLY